MTHEEKHLEHKKKNITLEMFSSFTEFLGIAFLVNAFFFMLDKNKEKPSSLININEVVIDIAIASVISIHSGLQSIEHNKKIDSYVTKIENERNKEHTKSI